MGYRTEYEAYAETECSTEYKEDCEYRWEGEGNEKVWAPIRSTCKQNPYDSCKEVPKQKERKVAYPVCNKVPQQKCVNVPRRSCVTVNEQQCTNVPRQACNSVHKKVPERISKRMPKKVCDDGSGSGYGNGSVAPQLLQDSGSGVIAVRSGSDKINFAED